MGNRPGFSLLELIVVLLLVSILAGLGGLAHRTLRPQLDLGMAARELMMDLKLVRMRAVAEHANYRIVFPGGSTSYQPQRKVTGGYKNEGRSVPLPHGILIADCTARDGAISFVPRGNAGSFGTVTIRNEKGEERHVTVNIAGQMRAY